MSRQTTAGRNSGGSQSRLSWLLPLPPGCSAAGQQQGAQQGSEQGAASCFDGRREQLWVVLENQGRNRRLVDSHPYTVLGPLLPLLLAVRVDQASSGEHGVKPLNCVLEFAPTTREGAGAPTAVTHVPVAVPPVVPLIFPHLKFNKSHFPMPYCCHLPCCPPHPIARLPASTPFDPAARLTL